MPTEGEIHKAKNYLCTRPEPPPKAPSDEVPLAGMPCAELSALPTEGEIHKAKNYL